MIKQTPEQLEHLKKLTERMNSPGFLAKFANLQWKWQQVARGNLSYREAYPELCPPPEEPNDGQSLFPRQKES